MNKSNKTFFLIILFDLSSSSIYSSGNLNDFELGTAIYRNLAASTSEDHWHSGVFRYFTYSNNMGYMYYTEAEGINHPTKNKNTEAIISISNYTNDVTVLKENFRNTFKNGNLYQGSYSVNSIEANTRSSISSTAQAVGSSLIEYTWQDMLDPNNVWCWDHYWYCEHWNGQIYNIDELRCDGTAEYSYEKNGIMVANNDLIGLSGQSHADAHNDLHTYGYNSGELCPKIQAGEDCNYYSPGSGTSHSLFDPLTALDPTISNFSRTQFSDKIQLNFKVADNASVKAYILIQVKKTSESTWHILIDKNDDTWKFKEVDLTDWNGSLQSDNFYIPWAGKHDGGYYSSSIHDFNIKITVIDQGANYSESNFSFIGNLPPLSVSVSGPSSLNQNQSGQFVSTPSNGVPPYSYSWKYFPICPDGGGIEKAEKGKRNSIQADMCGSWINFGGNIQIVSHSDTYCFYIESTVIDVANNTATATRYVSVSSNSNLIDDDEVVIETNAPAETKLFENFPNPFNPTTTIKYQLKNDGFVTIKIYDVLGKVVANLVNENKSSGFYSVSFDANDLPSGVYIYSIRTADFVANKKMLLMK